MMIPALIIDGKAAAEALRSGIAARVEALPSGKRPGLAVVLVGEDPASAVYVRSKARQTVAVGMRSFEHRLPSDVPQATLMELVARLNDDDDVHGILVQLPLPDHLSSDAVLRAIDPAKDVDGFSPWNAGLLATGSAGFVPCTPAGAMMLIRSVRSRLAGLNAIVIGRSNIVGKPMAQLLLEAHCTVTIAHSRTRDLPALVGAADIVVAAVGRPEFVRGGWLKRGATVIDVGINRVESPDGTRRLIGDVAFDEAIGTAGAITPVPGGVGPMTIALLLSNTLEAFERLTSAD